MSEIMKITEMNNCIEEMRKCYKFEDDKTEIICHEKDEYGNEHGSFWMTPDNHLHKTNPQGCPKCARNRTNNVPKGFQTLVENIRRDISCTHSSIQSDFKLHVTLGRITEPEADIDDVGFLIDEIDFKPFLRFNISLNSSFSLLNFQCAKIQ